MHVLHVVGNLGPGGMELTMARVITGLTGKGMRHSIACLRSGPMGGCRIGEYLPNGTPVYCLYPGPHELHLPARLAKLIRQISPAVIHARNWPAWPDTALGRLLAWPRPPLVFSFHGQGGTTRTPLRRRLASRLLVPLTTHLVALSDHSKQILVAEWGWPEERVEVIPNGVDTARFSPATVPRNTDRIVVGSVGHLRPVKNHAMLIRACAQLAREGLDLELRIAGGGKDGPRLLSLAQSLGFVDRLRLVGQVSDVPDFLRHLDIFVLSSNSEQHPNALNEAMACQLPCIATRVGCVGELLDEGRCGLIVPPGDTDALARALRDLISDPARGRELAVAARQRSCERYSLSRMLGAYEDMYRRLSNGAETPH